MTSYYNVGKMLSEAGKHYGKSILKDYSIRLSQELNNKYDVSYLNKMKKILFTHSKIGDTVAKIIIQSLC